jgi:hypothetical protein
VANGSAIDTVQVDLLTLGASGVDAFPGSTTLLHRQQRDGVIDEADTPNDTPWFGLGDVDFAWP